MEHQKKIAGYHSIIKMPTPPVEKTDFLPPKSSINQSNQQLIDSDEEENNISHSRRQETVQTMYEKDLDSSSNSDIDKLGQKYGQSTSREFIMNIDKLFNHICRDNPNDYIDSLSNKRTDENELSLKLRNLKQHNMNLRDKIKAIKNDKDDNYVLSEPQLKTAKELDSQYEKLCNKNNALKKQLENANNNRSNDYYKKRIDHILRSQLREYNGMIRDIKEKNKSSQSFVEKRKENNNYNNNYDSRCDFEECWSITNQSNLSSHSIEKDRGKHAGNSIPYTGNSNNNPNSNINSDSNTNKRNDNLLIRSTRINGGIVSKDLFNNINKNSINHSSHGKYNIPLSSFTNKSNTNRIKYTKN